ncbi:NAD(P)/FAD-dependent oxidoreductase [Paenibacillus urinalis]|uniref:NAD(P)/FAD-dependent oxidoreductase n=1 Tax=Paenibacillus urinalis TaxID=521520 RepID=A0AAX3N1K1_9BACL|nr:NAD(P)/FAD-dependent oxidoreductase [Paenibacillus urinalis]WDH83183.1 NAD(P)/FAD-dependent oxidoreductase [Paenibacillus urinalis]WDI02956.1 NAD(P)/FAD-dependent oxidoreductase [Paenibacillus urinalis]
MKKVIVIGGGPSGLMASVAAAEHGASVVLVDKGNKLGRKLGISGGGRCNVTNAKDQDELIKHIPGNGKFLYSAFQHMDNQGIMRFFEDLGIALKEEDNGRMFPVSDKAKTVVDALIGKASSLGVKMMTDSPVAEVLYEEGKVAGVKLASGKVVPADAVIVATGGKSVPQTGSTGDGYPWAEAAGHTITELYPTEVPITSNEAFITSRELQGLSLSDVALSVHDAKDKTVIRHEGDMIFTHFGLSGPIALRCSQFIRKVQKKTGTKNVIMKLDLYPAYPLSKMEQDLKDKLESEPKKAIKNALKGIVQERLIPVVLTKAALDGETTYHHLPKGSIETLAAVLKGMPIQVNGTRSLAEAFVTGGGVHLKEIYPKTMESKLMPGLFFCGEILDVHGYTGGYNITSAFSTGYTAGKHAAMEDTY